mmetsp:Transcript_24054/g.61441  ORF Transcript_24054/g.61441 Transcript_24054/m.61441 type:complete len:84 (+) Transcript_24054:173-424(+)
MSKKCDLLKRMVKSRAGSSCEERRVYIHVRFVQWWIGVMLLRRGLTSLVNVLALAPAGLGDISLVGVAVDGVRRECREATQRE